MSYTLNQDVAPFWRLKYVDRPLLSTKKGTRQKHKNCRNHLIRCPHKPIQSKYIVKSKNNKNVRTVPAVDFEDKKVWCFRRDKPKSQTCTFSKISKEAQGVC